MSRRQPNARTSATLVGSTVLLAAGLTVLASPTVSALDLPSPIATSTPTAPAVPPAPSVSGLVGQVTAPLASLATAAAPGTPSLPTGSATGLPALPAAPSSSSLGSVGSGVKSGLAAVKKQAAGSPVGPAVPGAGPGGVVDLGVNASPLATACLQVTGSGTAVANTTVTVAGHNVSAPLVQALPGLLAACPNGHLPPSQGLDASVSGLVGACVRVTPQPPLHASVLVLGKELVSTLARAGVPLEKAVVPCPAGTARAVGSSHNAHGASGAAAPAAGSKGAAKPAAGHGDAKGSGAACAPGSSDGTSIDARTTAAGLVPRDATQALPWVLLGLALVGRRRLGRVVTALRAARHAG